eukprot:s4497_g1.t1
MSGGAADFGHVHWHLVRFAVSKPLEESVLPEMPFAPPEGDCDDDSDSETTEHLEQFRHEQERDTLVSASGSSGSSYQAGQMAGFVYGVHGELASQRLAVRKAFVWIGGFPFEPEAGFSDCLIFGLLGSAPSGQDFDTGWEYLYDGLVCPEAGMNAPIWCDVQTEPRMAPVWHPIEEFSAYFRIVVKCTDNSLSVRERLTSPPATQFRAEASEGFQGAGAVVRICAEIA